MEQIEDVLKQEFALADQDPVYPKSERYEREVDISRRIAKAVVEALLRDPACSTRKPFRVLSNAIWRFELDPILANSTFFRTEQLLQSARDKESDGHKRSLLENALRDLELVAVNHFGEWQASYFERMTGPKKLARIKGMLHFLATDPVREKYLRRALVNAQEQLEFVISVEREKKVNIALYRDGLPPNNDTVDETADSSLTKRQMLIAMSYFVDHFGLLKSFNKIDFARLLAVLNNGKNFDFFRQDFGTKGLITAKTEPRAKRVADLFRERGLPEVAEAIETEINRIKSKDL